ncbi:GNAT family N-acetyltransferase [Methylophaga sp. 42_25_T18]|nr:GNAT family N-acetyltransferase [Methylophaga sp. 42_25_T18]
MNISAATTADIAELCSLLDLLFSQEAEFKADRTAQQRGLAMIINNPAIGDILVARQDGEIIAMVNLLYSVSTALGARVGIVEDMVVSPNARGSGVGSKLLNYAIEFAKDKGCERLTLLTDNDNLAAQRFYQRHGFTQSSMIPLRIPLNKK